MGEVFLAHDERLGRKVAIKRLRPSSDVPTAHRERFRREAKIAARLKHPAIVQIYDVVRDGEVDCIVMEYVEGQDLRRCMDAAPLGIHEVLAIGGQIASAMAEAHAHGIIHRDLKSENVLVTRTGEVKITDFGIAKDLRDETLTADGHVLGTYRAMSPEQALGRPLDHRSDLFSFGVLLYEALTGTSPFRAETPFLTLQRVVHGEVLPLRRLQPALPDTLAGLVEQLLQKDPLLRPRDFDDVAGALAAIQAEIPDQPCSDTKTSRRPTSEYDGQTLGGEVPGSTPVSGDAPVASSEPGDTGTPAAGPAAMRDARAVLAMAATHPSDQPMLRSPEEPAAATVRAVPARAAPAARASAAEPGDSAVSIEAPDAPSVPARRYTRRLAVLATAGAALALGLGYQLWNGNRPAHRLTYVAVPAPIIDAAAEPDDAALMAAAVRGGVVRGLFALEGIAVLPPQDASVVTEGYVHERGRQPDAGEVARAMGADEVIETWLRCTRERCRVTWKRSARDGSTRATAAFEISRHDPIGSEQAVLGNLHALYDNHPRRDDGAEARLTPEDYAAYVRARNAHWADEDSIASDARLEEIQGIQERAPEFVAAYLLELDMRHRRARRRDSIAEFSDALVPLRKAVERAPNSYALLAAQLDLAVQVDSRRLARDTLRRIETLDPESGWTSLLRGQWHAHIEEQQEALDVLRRAAVPGAFWRVWYRLAMLERDLDEPASARARLGQLLEQSPGNYAGLSLLASVEMWGNPACAAERYQALLKRHRYPDECMNLGVTQSLLDQHQDAAESYRCALEARPGDALGLFNYAEALKLAGDTQMADQKFRELIDSLRAQKPVRTLFERSLEILALAHLGQRDVTRAEEARRLTQHMLAEIPEAPSLDVSYTVATVYALLGDEHLAIKHVSVLLDGGREVYWFRFPWFDGLRRHPELGQRLAYEPPATTCKQ